MKKISIGITMIIIFMFCLFIEQNYTREVTVIDINKGIVYPSLKKSSSSVQINFSWLIFLSGKIRSSNFLQISGFSITSANTTGLQIVYLISLFIIEPFPFFSVDGFRHHNHSIYHCQWKKEIMSYFRDFLSDFRDLLYLRFSPQGKLGKYIVL